MDFDSRWNDGPRDRDDDGLRAEALAKVRDVFTRDLELPRGRERERVWARDSDVRLRGSEVRALATVGAFRVVPAGDLRDGQDRRLDPHRGDLRHLRDQGLVDTIPAIGNDRALVVLTERGRDVLERNRWSSVHREELKWAAVEREFDNRRDVDDERTRPQEPKGRQEFHVGVRSGRHTRFAVHRPRELTHDAQVYRAYPYVDGYKPRFNFQALLEQVVLEYLDVHRDFFEPLITGPVLNPTTSPDPGTLDTGRLVELPPEAMRIPQAVWSPTTRLSRFDFVARDAANRDLGRRGEEFVLEFERKRLHDGGRRDLVQRIEWTAQARGDGAGYDLQSFNADGSTRLIEVKTTGLGKYFPFNVTVNEVRCSEARPGEFQLYRVFNFGPGARLYMLPGAISGSCHLDATQYRAFVQSTGP